MEVAARRVHPERPAFVARLLPGREAHRVAKEGADRTDVHALGRDGAREIQAVERDRGPGVRVLAWQFEKGRGPICAKRARHRREVEMPERTREAVEVMEGAVVVVENGHSTCRLPPARCRLAVCLSISTT